MTPKEKAKELFDSFDLYVKNNKPDYEKYFDKQVAISVSKHNAKQCAFIAVYEILDECCNWVGGSMDNGWETNRFDYWQQVKTEITNL